MTAQPFPSVPLASSRASVCPQCLESLASWLSSEERQPSDVSPRIAFDRLGTAALSVQSHPSTCSFVGTHLSSAFCLLWLQLCKDISKF